MAKTRRNVTGEFDGGQRIDRMPDSEVVSERMRKHDLHPDKTRKCLSNVD